MMVALGSASRSRRRTQRTSVGFTPGVDRLEGRIVLSMAPTAPIALPAVAIQQAATASLNQRVVDYLNQNIGKRIGSGECADLATEALRVAGAKFTNIGTDNPSPGDYVWGSLVKSYDVKGGRVVDSNPSAAIQPGDVLQYHGATFSTGSVATHHTAVVAAVDSSGRITKVFQQNISSTGIKGVNRMDTLSALDLSKLSGGYVRVYHPIARVTTPNRYEFTLVNNASTAEKITFFGSTDSFTPANTSGSMLTFSATGLPKITLNGKTYTLSDAAGYQIVGVGSSATLQKLSA